MTSSAALGASDTATWNRNVERLDFHTTTPQGGDNAFFSYVANATAGANVVLLYPANNSMKELTQRLYKIRVDLGGATPTGCTNAYLNGLTYFMPTTVNPPVGLASMQGAFDPSKAYPDPGAVYTNDGQDDKMGDRNGRSLATTIAGDNDDFYLYGNWPQPDGNGGNIPGVKSRRGAACTALTGAVAGNAVFDDCYACLGTRGYWLNPAAANNDVSTTAGVFSKQFLRFHPPKWTLLSLAYKRLVNGPLLRSLREGVIATNGSTGGQLIQKMLPQSCNGSGRPLNQKLDAIDGLDYRSTARPLAELLFNSAWFMGGQDTNPWVFPAGVGRQNLYWDGTGGTYPQGTGGSGAWPNSKSGPCNGCNSDFLILFSDGRGDTANPLCGAVAAAGYSPISGATTLDCDGAGPEGSPSTSSGSFGANGATCAIYACSAGFWCQRTGGLANDCNGYTNGTQTCGVESSAGGAFCSAASVCTTAGLGTEMDGDQFELNPTAFPASGVTTAITGPALLAAPAAGTCLWDFADDVAGWMATTNVSSQGTAGSVITHVVGVGDPDNTYGEMSILSSIAARGTGNYIAADNFRDLESAIEQIFYVIRGAATSFASSAVTTVQTTGTSSAFIPRFTPAISGPWSGSLSRYVLFNEFSAGCTQTDLGTVTTLNPNGDNSCSDFYLKDRNGNFIQEDQSGQFIVSNNATAWDGGWPPVITADGGSQLAVPYWEAGNKLYTRAAAIVAFDAGVGAMPAEGIRRIFTVSSGACTTASNTAAPPPANNCYGTTAIPFTTANAATLAPMLGLGADQNSEWCVALAAATGNTYASVTDCAVDVIRFVHGEDILSENPLNRPRPDAGVTVPVPREKVLGDIFHSSPILVTPPAPKFLCDLGVINQCVASLYSTPTAGGSVEYSNYFNAQKERASNVLVGANDGMLHAFNAANADAGTDGGIVFDEGTGVESWAFIPPDLLPKLVRNIIGERHELMVDGTAMVRDIWVDGCPNTSGPSACTAGDGNKQADEFHTIAIIGERQGGRGYTALDITDPYTPRFLWSWPAPGTTDAITMGQTWGDIGGAPPAIGPVKQGGSGELYVVAFGGGYDPNLVRGRSFHVLDAYRGIEVYELRNSNLASVAAPISLIDTDSDYYFDFAVFGDMDGNVWSVSMQNPAFSGGVFTNWYAGRAFQQRMGAVDYDLRNPFFQRAAVGMLPTGDIRVFLGSGDRAHLKDTKGGLCSPENPSACLRRSCDLTIDNNFYTIAAGPIASATSGNYIDRWLTINNGGDTITNALTYSSITTPTSAATNHMRAQIDYSIQCPGGSAVTAQSAANCNWGATDAGVECPLSAPLGTTQVSQASNPTIADSRFYSIKLFTASGARAKFNTAAGATNYDNARLSDTLSYQASGGVAPNTLRDVSQCPGGGLCAPSSVVDDGWFISHGTVQLPASTHTADEKTAASALLFGGCVLWSTLDPNGVGGASGTGQGTCSAAAPLAYQGAACSSNADCGATSGTCVGGNDNGDTCDNPNDCEGYCNGGRDNGDDCRRNSDCRDGAACTAFGNCSVPNWCVGLGSLSCTPSFPKDTAWSYQSDAITGNVGCGLAGSQTALNTTTRAVSRQVSVAPTQPAPVVSVNAATGMIQYSAVTLDATSAPAGTQLGSSQISSTVHWLEVPRKVHDCRHNNGAFPSPNCQ